MLKMFERKINDTILSKLLKEFKIIKFDDCLIEDLQWMFSTFKNSLIYRYLESDISKDIKIIED